MVVTRLGAGLYSWPEVFRLLQAAGESDEAEEEDADVAAERARVASGAAASDSLCLRDLRKVYGSGAAAKVGFTAGLGTFL